MNFDKVPQELKELNQWVCWQLIERQGKQTKLPRNARTGAMASSVDPSTWSSFDEAVRNAKSFNGIGFVFSESDPYFGVDLDGNIDMDLVEWFGSYTERSQSGTGCHIIGKGKLNRKGCKITNGKHEGFEVYDRGRYFVVTGDVIKGEPIRECQEKLDQFVATVLPAEKNVDLSSLLPIGSCEHIDIIQQIRLSAQGAKFDALWGGNWRHIYGSQSEADAALLSILRFWTGGDKMESFSLFRQSGLMRKKAERQDYMDRTWAKIDKGEVRESVQIETARPPRIMAEQSSSPWRRITIDHVAKAIEGTILEPMCRALCSPCDPPIPLEVGILKALSLCGCALCGMKSKRENIGDYIAKGVDLSRIRIMTSGGQSPNFYCLLVGRSASGKDIGNLVYKAASQLQYMIGTSGSEEGLMDAYAEKPTGLLQVSEMLNFLDAKHWQHRAANFLTQAFNQGTYDVSLSKRSDAPRRRSDYCFPNIMASVQPGVISEHATRTAVESGFLGRFIIAQMPDDFLPYPKICDGRAEVIEIIELLKILQCKSGDIYPQERYQQKLFEMFDRHKAEPRPTWFRLCNEYLPRFGLLLSIPKDDKGTKAAQLTQDGMDRAAVLVQYFFGQAEKVFGTICNDPQQARFEELCKRMLAHIETKGQCTKSELGWYCGRNSKARDRNEAIAELIDRGKIEMIAKQGKPTMLKAINKW